MYVDECKAKGYYIAAAVVMPNDASQLDKALRKLTRPGQRRIHFVKESPQSKRKILAAITELGVSVVVYQVKGLPDKEARPLCLNALVDDVAAGGVQAVILERDESLEGADRQIIAAALQRNNGYPLSYHHAAPSEHPLLWVSDIAAWCCYSGGEWADRASGIIVEVRTLAR